MKFIDLVKKWAWQVIAILFLLLWIGKGCTNKQLSKTNKMITENNIELVSTVDSLSGIITEYNENTPTKKEVKDMMELTMLDFLIYEDDLDKGKISLSQIKDKIEAND